MLGAESSLTCVLRATLHCEEVRQAELPSPPLCVTTTIPRAGSLLESALGYHLAGLGHKSEITKHRFTAAAAQPLVFARRSFHRLGCEGRVLSAPCLTHARAARGLSTGWLLTAFLVHGGGKWPLQSHAWSCQGPFPEASRACARSRTGEWTAKT